MLIQRERDIIIYYYNNGNTYVNIESGQHLLGCAGLIHTNTWDHLAFTFNGSHAVLYQNGIEKCSSDVAYNLDPSTDPLTIGTYARTVPNDYFNGLIDEVAIWNRTLSAAEILEHYKRSALNLTFQVRSDGDNASWPDYIGPDNTSSSYFTNASLANLSLTNLSNARYFQYKAYFDTNNTAYTPELWNVTGGYEDEIAPTISISSPSNTTYTTASIDLNWTYDETPDWCAYSLNGGANDTSIGPTKWWSNTNINSSLGSVGYRSAPEVFNMGGTWYLIAGENAGVFYGFNWTGSAWQADSRIATDLGDIGHYAKPAVFNMSGTWYLIAGEYDGVFNGYNWTGSAWQADSHIASGLGDVEYESAPEVFNMGGTWYLIAGEWRDGVFNGYNWTGSVWQADSHIASGLGGVGAESAPEVFNMSGTWYLIAGEEDGVFNGYNWTGSAWQSDSNIVSGLGDIGTRSKPAVFNMSGTWYLIAGENNGVFYGYNWSFKPTNTTITAQQGGNNITIWANDTAGNMGQSSYVYFTVDSIYPTVDLDLPDNTTYSTNESLALNYSVYDVNQDSCWYNIDSGSNTSLASCANTTFNVSGLGGYTLTLYANDTFGNENSSSVVFTVDLTPTSTLISPANATYSNGTTTFTCNGSDGTDLSAITLYIWNSTAIYSTNATSANGVSAQASWNYTLPENNYTWNCLANDTQNNEDWDTNRTLYVDTTFPQINFTSPTDSNASYVARNWTAINASIVESNLDTLKLDWNGTNYTCGVKSYFGNGNYSCTDYDNSSLVLAMNFDNNSAIGENSTYAVDSSQYGNNGTFYESGGPAWTASGKFGSALQFDGSNDYVDCGNNASLMPTNAITLSAWFKVPSSGQTFIIISQDIVSSSNKGYTIFTYSNTLYIDIGDGSAYHRVTTSEPSSGVWHFVVATYDGSIQKMYIDGEIAGTPSSWEGTISYNDYVVYIGRSSLGQYSAGTIDEVAIYNRSLSADEIKIHYESKLSKYNSTQWYYYNKLINQTDGSYSYYLYAKDLANNSNQTETRTLTIDTTAPVISLTYPTNNSYLNQAWINITGTASDANNDTVYVNDTRFGDNTGTYASWNFTNTSIAEGTYSVLITANDSANNTNSTNVVFTIDRTNPQINFTDPTEASGTYVGKNYTYVNVTVNDTNQVSSFINWNYSLVGYWNFNDGAATDNSTYGYDGTISGATSVVGKFGSALEFDGSNDRVYDINLGYTTEFRTLMLWVYQPSYQSLAYTGLFSDRYAGLRIDPGANAELNFYCSPTGCTGGHATSNYNMPTGEWVHVALTFNGTNILWYKNGDYIEASDLSGYPSSDVCECESLASDGTWSLAHNEGDNRYFNGSIDEVQIWNRALSVEEINASYNTGLYSLYHNFTGLADGNYSYYAQTIDLAGNMNQTETRNLIIDTTAPNVSLISPANDTYTSDTSPNLTANITDNLGIKNATLHIYNETDSINETTTSFSEGTVERLLGIVYNFLYDGVFKWFYSAYDWAGNLFNAGNYTLTIDTTDPLISVTFPSNNSNLSQTWINITGTASDENTDTIYVNDTRFGDNTGTYTSWNFTNTTIADGTYSVLITANDSANNTNSSTIIFTIDATAPNITNMSISPSTAADVDPNVNINVTVNVTDATTGIDTIVLRYWNYSTNVSTSSNVTMSSAGGDLFNASFNASVNGTWYYQVWANDSAGNNINNTPNSTDVQYECTWSISDTISDPTLGAFETTDVIGNITINNTGDASYPIHSCTLSFILTDNLATGRISYSPSDAVIGLAAKDTSTVNITATFLNKVVSEGLVITITEYGRKSATYQTTSNATLTSYAGGPYLNVVINSSPSAVNQTAALNFTLSVYVQNIGNESASNVTLNWTLPTGWGNLSGLLNVNDSTLNCSDPTISPSIGCTTNASLNTLVNLITATVSNPNTASIGTVTIYANTSSESKVNSSCSSNCSYVNASDSATATVSCYAVSDGVCPTSGTCSYDSTANNYDPDCTAPAAETITTGGGGGAGAAPAAIVAEAIYELVRGKDEDFSLEVKNPFKDASLRDIKMKVTGFLAPYITIEPAVLDKIEPNSTFNFTIRITAPAYFTVGKHDLTFTISSTKQVGVTETARTEKRYVTLAIHDVGRGDAAQLVSDSEDAIAEMMQLGLNVKKVQQLLSELQDEFEKSKYENVKELSQKVSTIKQNALSSQDTIESLQEKIKDAEGKGIKAEDTKILLNLAIAAFERGDYALALERAKDAEMTYAVETKGEFNLLYFVANNTIECLVGIIILTFLSALLFLKVKLSITNHSITSLYSEQDILLGLMKTVQHECFIEKKMSMGEYRQSMLEYEDRFSKAVQHALKLESIKANLFKLKKKGLEMERQGILKLMKELQSKYIKEGKVETRVYDQKMQSFTARLSEIEEQIALNEAKRALHRAKRRRFLRRFGLARPKATERLARKKKQTEHKRMKLKEKIKRRFESVIKKATEKKEKELDRKRKEQIERAKEEAPKQRKKEKLREKIRKRFERVVEREEKKRAKSRKK